ncbi:DUF3019 domain-containing protein [Gilvimarinus sp. SDUM040013]|uniref:DUF3019 domain-containing protein n=1 Tax=Gilvimarinus gilvus TaxID=3058038 RepID=A0ABU4RXU5_9GAMM|nr:DUF3019 domain-containing protein [Gilvimarinus sp. SDUM040013]MDO3386451.1 DUF3019 domain-containing protein [Gilvimarinus sp. SDUM040013]MDX6849717.1 DUF3019 domain-containing protein [Gilvimarinus sp. SDUM040013]
MLAISGICWGQEGDEAQVELTVQPSLCILERGETLCRDKVEVRWQTVRLYSVCLFEAGQPEPLSCWDESRSGEYLSQLHTEDDIHFQLIEMAERQVLASRAFEVVADAQRYRRRRRNPWSFF